MTASRDISSVVRSWIREEEYDSADRVLQVVLSQLDSTPQRRPFWRARRFPNMNSPVRYAIAAAAVLVVAFVGYQLLPGRTTTPSAPSTAPSSAPAPAASPTRDTRPNVPAAGPLDPGVRHFARLEGVGFTFEVPAGWISNGDFGMDHQAGVAPDGGGFIFWADHAADAVFADPCAETLAEPAGPSARELATAISEMPQIELVSGPTAVTVGGRPGQLVVIRIPDELPCDPEQFYLWGGPNGNPARYATATGSTIHVWLVDVDGARVQIDGETYDGAGPEQADELQAIIDSIEFE
jgi:hypothetical protein